MPIFKNIENFVKFLDENLKQPHGCYNLDAYIDDLVKRHRETGSCIYELHAIETVSRRPESFFYTVKDKFIIDGAEVPPCDDFDYVETTYIF